MNPIVSPLWFYVINTVDAIHTVSGFSIVLSVIVLFFALFIYMSVSN